MLGRGLPRPTGRRTAGTLALAGALLTATATGAGPAAASTASWGAVTTIWHHGFEDVTSVTTDSGMVVASWIGVDGRLWVATRQVGEPWSGVTTVPGSVAASAIVKDGNSAWLLGQNFDTVFVLQVHQDGHLDDPTTIGTSGDPFISDARISVGANGAVAAAWHATGETPKYAYKPAGEAWQQSGYLPMHGNLEGLAVGAAGVTQFVLSKDAPDFRHQKISYLRLTTSGTWTAPVRVAGHAWLATAAGNQHGDIVVGWQVDEGDTYSVYGRYRPAEGGFGPPQLLATDVPYGSDVELGMADDGSAAAAYRVTDSGSHELRVARVGTDGTWSGAESLAMTGSTYDVAMNGAGDFVVASRAGLGVQLTRCSTTDACGVTDTHGATRYRFPSTTLSPAGIITLLWGRGCKTEECAPTSLVTQRGR